MAEKPTETGPIRVTPSAFFLTASIMLGVGFGVGYRRMSARKQVQRLTKLPQHRPELLYSSEAINTVRLEDVTEKADVTLAAKALAMGTLLAVSSFGLVVGGACYAMDVRSVADFRRQAELRLKGGLQPVKNYLGTSKDSQGGEQEQPPST